MKRKTSIILFVFLTVAAGSAWAGGFDTPILYTARHMGMGGAAIGYVYDPSAVFHNPAGLSHVEGFSAIGDFSPVIGAIEANPASGISDRTELSFAPFFLVGAAYRLTPWMTVGLAGYPVASSGGMYIYENAAGIELEDETKLAFIEVSPAVSFDLPYDLRLGLAYRMTLLQFTRRQEPSAGATSSMFDINLSGFDFLGFKAGLQWTPLTWLQAGLVYRHQTKIEVTADSSTIVYQDWGHTSMEFTLPSKLGLGLRADVPDTGLGVAIDAEYGFNSQNEVSYIHAESLSGGDPAHIASQFRWSDSVTLRGGVEYTFMPELIGRLGYIFDAKTANEQYPTAFGTPPNHTQTITAGVGSRFAEHYRVNLAYAYRFGWATVTDADVADREYTCIPCSYPGEYFIGLHGIYVDFSVDF